MKTIMVDMDEVITTGNFNKVLEDYLGHEIDDNSINGYYIQDVLGDNKEDFFNYFKSINLYENAELLPDCYNVLKKLSNVYKIYICTDYIWKEIIECAGDNLKNKYNFLYKELDFISPRNYIFTADKSIINCDIKIDDKLENIDGAALKLLFTAYHNKNLLDDELASSNIKRVNNWKEIEELLLKGNE